MIFDRQIAFWGEAKQRQLEQGVVFVAGLGGLGCLLAELLVRGGIGKIYLCDRGQVDLPDLNRQLFYTQLDVGRPKVEIAQKRLLSIHSLSQVIALDGDILEEAFVLPVDIAGVADCLDNFESRFSLWNKLPNGLFFVHAGVERFYGQIITLIKGSSCPPQTLFANCQDSQQPIPVSGASAASLSALATNEVIYNLFAEPKLRDTLLVVDLAAFQFNKIAIAKPT